MAVTTSIYNKFIEHVGKGDVNLGSDTFKIILVYGYSFNSADDILDDIGSVEIADGNGYTAGGGELTNVTFAYNSSYTKLDADDFSWEASGGTIGNATGAIIYDDTNTDKVLMCYVDFGQTESAGDGTEFKITFNANGIFRISQ